MENEKIKNNANDLSLNNLIQGLGLSLIAAGVVSILNSFWSGLFAIIIGLYLISRMNKHVQDLAIDSLERIKNKHPQKVNWIGRIEWFYIKIMQWKIVNVENNQNKDNLTEKSLK